MQPPALAPAAPAPWNSIPENINPDFKWINLYVCKHCNHKYYKQEPFDWRATPVSLMNLFCIYCGKVASGFQAYSNSQKHLRKVENWVGRKLKELAVEHLPSYGGKANEFILNSFDHRQISCKKCQQTWWSGADADKITSCKTCRTSEHVFLVSRRFVTGTAVCYCMDCDFASVFSNTSATKALGCVKCREPRVTLAVLPDFVATLWRDIMKTNRNRKLRKDKRDAKKAADFFAKKAASLKTTASPRLDVVDQDSTTASPPASKEEDSFSQGESNSDDDEFSFNQLDDQNSGITEWDYFSSVATLHPLIENSEMVVAYNSAFRKAAFMCLDPMTFMLLEKTAASMCNDKRRANVILTPPNGNY